MIPRLLALGSVALTPAAWALDLQPGELIPRPAGTNIVQIAYFDVLRDGLYDDGARLPGNFSVEADQFQLRYVHYSDLAGKPTLFYVQLPIGDIKPGGLWEGLGGDAGTGDPVFLFATWPYANHETGEYLAVGAYLSPATGSYDKQNLSNMGENRNRAALQAAYQGLLFGRLEWMGAFDAVWHDTNDEYYPGNRRLEQKLLYTAQFGVNYLVTPLVGIGVSYIHSWGAERTIDGVDQNDPQRVDRYLISLGWRIPEWRSKVILQYGRDIETENGLEETRRFIARYSYQF